jgi:hypothetical protein
MRRATPVGPPNEPKEGFVLSAPRGFAFILAVILGAMLVPGCRPSNSRGSSAPAEPVVAQLGATHPTVFEGKGGPRLNALKAAE